jgi:hypothetical protein
MLPKSDLGVQQTNHSSWRWLDESFLFSDNDFEYLSPEIKNLVNLRILAIRDNELVSVAL